jgi:hypothetical protein
MDPKSIALMAAVAVAGLGGLYLIRQAKDKDTEPADTDCSASALWSLGGPVGYAGGQIAKKICEDNHPGASAVVPGRAASILARIKAGQDAVSAGNMALANAQRESAQGDFTAYVASFGEDDALKYDKELGPVVPALLQLSTNIDMWLATNKLDYLKQVDKLADDSKKRVLQGSVDDVTLIVRSAQQVTRTALLTGVLIADDADVPINGIVDKKNLADVYDLARRLFAQYYGKYVKWIATADLQVLGSDWPDWLITPDIQNARDDVALKQQQEANRAKLAPILNKAAATGSALEKLAAAASQEQKDAIYLRVLDAASPTQRLDMWNKLSLVDRTRLHALIASGEVQGLSGSLTNSSVY